ncbi:MAG: hypothetical protein J6O13_11235 [Selenomonas sp.]|nr:hypothetical protein [Selenomonas sp.]
MTEKQFNNALQDSLMIDGISLEAFMAAKKVSDLCENTLTRTERNILLHLTRYGVKNLDDIEQYWGIPAERAKEIYDAAMQKLKVAAGVC